MLFPANLILAGRRCAFGRNGVQLEIASLVARSGLLFGGQPSPRPFHGKPIRSAIFASGTGVPPVSFWFGATGRDARATSRPCALQETDAPHINRSVR